MNNFCESVWAIKKIYVSYYQALDFNRYIKDILHLLCCLKFYFLTYFCSLNLSCIKSNVVNSPIFLYVTTYISWHFLFFGCFKNVVAMLFDAYIFISVISLLWIVAFSIKHFPLLQEFELFLNCIISFAMSALFYLPLSWYIFIHSCNFRFRNIFF